MAGTLILYMRQSRKWGIEYGWKNSCVVGARPGKETRVTAGLFHNEMCATGRDENDFFVDSYWVDF